MKLTKKELQRKTKKELIDIILKLQKPFVKIVPYVDEYNTSSIVIADGTQGMKRGE